MLYVKPMPQIWPEPTLHSLTCFTNRLKLKRFGNKGLIPTFRYSSLTKQILDCGTLLNYFWSYYLETEPPSLTRIVLNFCASYSVIFMSVNGNHCLCHPAVFPVHCETKTSRAWPHYPGPPIDPTASLNKQIYVIFYHFLSGFDILLVTS